MYIERYLRLIAGLLVLVTLALGYWVHPAWFLFTAFVGINLLQSSVTGFCPLERVLGRLGLAGCSAARDAAGSSRREDAPAGPGL